MKQTETIRLTDAAIRQYRNSPVTTLRDTSMPLYFRYTRSRESGSFFLVKRPGNNKSARWHHLGRASQMTASVAREACQIKINRLATDRPLLPDDAIKLKTLHQVLNWYRERRQRESEISRFTRRNTAASIKRSLLLLPDVPIDEANKALINDRLYEPMLGRYKLSTFQTTLKTVKAALAQAAALEMIASNPLEDCNYQSFTKRKPPPRLNRLDESGIKPLLASLKKAPLNTRMLAVWILMHGSRVGEAANANILRMRAGRWEIREDENKGQQLNIIPITHYAQRILDDYRHIQRHRYGYRGRYLFHQKRNRRRPISANQGSNAVSTATGGRYSPHDLRKRARTWWLDNGVDYFVGELLLGHKMKDLDVTYMQTQAQTVTRQALEKWHEYLVSQGLFTLFE